MPSWGFLTNHARVLLAIADDPGIRLREIADVVGITERRTHAIVTDLSVDGYLTKQREGRRNRYTVQTQRPLGEALSDRRTVGDLVALLAAGDDDGRVRPPRPADAATPPGGTVDDGSSASG
ncbi:MAG: MarR family winged helix-turn-helix transcriptional regulator [Actinobacteria bacterium]|nr:MarR family winged helix-turn-helix transcriptional regulator [Actinomycetota bacterium]